MQDITIIHWKEKTRFIQEYRLERDKHEEENENIHKCIIFQYVPYQYFF